MNSKGESLWLVGNGMATERACVLVQKLADGHGFTWYRRVAYYDLLPEMGRSDFSTETGKRCFDASLMKRFEALF
jgi:hypothetical protein